ncbi:MAG TPA: sulfotransferase [Rhodanobacteraceae bacterium]|nr:sulfotransferase [Rhodanobacteraceae bacterium]
MTDPATLYAEAVAALNRADWSRARALTGQLLGAVPQHAGVHFVAGVAALELHDLPVALKHLHRAATLSPKRADYAAQLARALAAASLLKEALIAADHAFALKPGDPMTLGTLGVVYSRANIHPRAAEAFRRAAEASPDNARLRFNLATSLVASGDFDRAETELERCLALDPGFWKAWLSLAQVRTQTRARNQVDRLRARLGDAGDQPEAQMYLNLALAKQYEDLGEFERAFAHLSRGKTAGAAGRGYTIERDKALFDALIEAVQARPDAAGFASSEPIFLIGMPRTGTTLADRILSSHPDVYSAGELPNFGTVLKRASRSGTPLLLDPDTIALAGRCDPAQLGRAYVDSTRPATAAKPHFVDKLPHNFLYAGFIASALPAAKIICMRRNPMDTCLSNFRQLFMQESPFYDYSFDILDCGRYYLLFDRLMTHWKNVFPGRILEVEYETLVDRQEEVSRQMLEFCGLPWDDACLRFEQNRAAVSTASAVQVRSPMFRTSLDRWKRYEPQLTELKALLTGAGVRIGD